VTADYRDVISPRAFRCTRLRGSCELCEGTSGSRQSAAFFVGLSENMGPVVDNTDVVFDRVVTNVGNAYDPDTGKFAAPGDPLTP